MNRLPTKLAARQHREIQNPLTVAVLALRLGTADSEHYHSLAGAMMIGHRVAGLVQRHRHSQADMQPSLDALNAIFVRREHGWSGTVEEVNDIEIGVAIYDGLMRTTPAKILKRAITHLQIEAVEAAKEGV